jgi:hypothetical protein
MTDLSDLFIVVGRHRFDADPEPTFHFDADSDLDPTTTFNQNFFYF